MSLQRTSGTYIIHRIKKIRLNPLWAILNMNQLWITKICICYIKHYLMSATLFASFWSIENTIYSILLDLSIFFKDRCIYSLLFWKFTIILVLPGHLTQDYPLKINLGKTNYSETDRQICVCRRSWYIAGARQ